MLGNIFEAKEYAEALASYKKALTIEPEYEKAWDHLGRLYSRLDQNAEAEVCYQKLVSIDTAYLPSFKSQGLVQFERGQYKSALKYFDMYNTPSSLAEALECLYALGELDEILHRLESRGEHYRKNLKVAAFSSFMSSVTGRNTGHRFCNNPLDFVSVSKLSSTYNDSGQFILDLIDDLKSLPTKWQPQNQSVRGGSQTAEIFSYPRRSFEKLKDVIRSDRRLL